MPQLVTRIDRSLLDELDRLVADGAAESRSSAVRLALGQLIDRHRRGEAGRRIAEDYIQRPQEQSEVGWSDLATVQMIADEPW